jgi:hypothetical protein
MASGDHITLNIAMTSPGTFADTLSLACLDLPVDATCTFSANEVKLAANGSATAQVVLDTGRPLGAGPRASVKTTTNREAALAFPAALLLGLITLFTRKRRRTLGALLSILLLAVAGLGLSGCGSSLNVSKTPPGSYNIRVLATGSTGVTESANVTLTVQ